jgi:hypothetical protein
VATTPQLAVSGDTIHVDRVTTTVTVRSPYAASPDTRPGLYYKGNGVISVSDGDVQFTFGLTQLLELRAVDPVNRAMTTHPLGLSVHVRNSSQDVLQIDWNPVTLLGKDGVVSPIIHSGVKIADRSAIMVASTIPPGGTLADFVYPRNVISLVGRSWYGSIYFEAMDPGTRFTLYLPIKRGNETAEYQFTFQVDPPRE